jgi:hypothetical protein
MICSYDMEMIEARVKAAFQSCNSRDENWHLSSPWQWIKCYLLTARFRKRHPIKVRRVIKEAWQAGGYSRKIKTVMTTKLVPPFMIDRSLATQLRVKRFRRKIIARRFLFLEPR